MYIDRIRYGSKVTNEHGRREPTVDRPTTNIEIIQKLGHIRDKGQLVSVWCVIFVFSHVETV